MTENRLLMPLIFLIVGQLLVIGLLTMNYVGNVPDLSTHIYWYMGRSSGFVAYWLLFASVAMGLAVGSRVFDGLFARPWVYEVHKFLSIFVIIGMIFHALIMIPDPYAGFTIDELLIPFRSQYRSAAVGLGAIVLYGSMIVSASFYLKGLIGQSLWRKLHYLTFALFIGAMAHGIWSGTDSGKTAVQVSYLASGIAVLFLTFFRILATRAVGGKPRPARAGAAPAPKAGATPAQPAPATPAGRPPGEPGPSKPIANPGPAASQLQAQPAMAAPGERALDISRS